KTIQWKLNKDFEIKDIVKNIQYVILENDSQESMFHEINKLIIKNDRIYILDSDSPSLLVFDIKGKFLHRIGRQGNGPGEYVRFINFTVNESDEVFVYDIAKGNIMKFDKGGNFIDSNESLFGLRDFVHLPDDQFLSSLNIHVKNNLNRKVILTDDFRESDKSFFTYHKNFMDNRFNLVTFTSFEDKIAYMYPVNDTLFIFDHHGSLREAWFFDFGRRRLPENLKNDYMKTLEEERRGNSNHIYITETPICFKNYIFAEIRINGQNGIFVYDTAKNKTTYEILAPETFSLYNINVPMCNVSDSLIASCLYIDTYLIIKDKISVSSEIDAHLENGGVVIILYTIE
ncbi:MAG: 6-bladed beta-propeller, partial [Bacteroidales bacterium]|nr:6-bladed beta-propeller [Bacteroidales bacterium]